jgi:hypothetical protein
LQDCRSAKEAMQPAGLRIAGPASFHSLSRLRLPGKSKIDRETEGWHAGAPVSDEELARQAALVAANALQPTAQSVAWTL